LRKRESMVFLFSEAGEKRTAAITPCRGRGGIAAPLREVLSQTYMASNSRVGKEKKVPRGLVANR